MRMIKFLAGTVSVLALTAGCASGSQGSAAGEEQTPVEACNVITTGLGELYRSVGHFESAVAGDAEGALEVAGEKIAEINKQVSNPEVVALWEPLAAAQKIAFEAVADDNEDELARALNAAAEHYAELEEFCQSVGAE